MSPLRIPSLLALCTVLATGGCGSSTEPSGAPALPAAESMTLDLSFFQEPAKPAPATTRFHFAKAATRAGIINLGVLAALAPPRLAFGLAVHTTPNLQEDGSYLWIYTWSNGTEDFQIRLSGRPDGDHVDWTLSLVPPGESPALWFSGESVPGGKAGFWVFRDVNAPGDPEAMRIDWDLTASTDARLSFVNIRDGAADEDDVLSYRKNGSVASMEFEDASENALWDIRWDEGDGSGSLRVPEYNNGERGCWDMNRDDVPCNPS